MATWPNTLPAPLLQSYNNRDQLPIIKTQMQSGPQRRTRYSDHYMTTGSMSLTVNAAQAADLQQVIHDSNLGADWINSCPIDTGSGLKNHRVRITSVLRKVIKPPDQLWTYTLAFESDEHL